MEDDHILLPPTGSTRQQARNSCSKGTAYTVFSLLGVLLLAGQAVTVYFVYQHDNQITKLTKNTQQLKLDSLTGSISKNVQRSGPKMAIANVMPLALNEPEFLQMENKLTNSTEDQVKRLLLRENPTRTFPELKSNFQENMGHLKIRMAYNDWKEFETWMHKWLIFQMAQKQNTEEKGIAGPTEAPVQPTHRLPATKSPQGGILDPENVTYSGDQTDGSLQKI